jgi:hypothetical protein
MNTKSIPRIPQYLMLGLLVLITACSPLIAIERPTNGTPSPAAPPTQDTNALYTAAAQTIQAQTPTQAAATVTLVPQTVTQAEAPQLTATSAPVVTECQDAAEYIADDGMDGTTYTPNTPFTKTWTVKNTGSCTWDDGYLVSFISGDIMTQQPGYFILPQGQTVAPGQTVNIRIDMSSPPENGNYKSNWGLQKENGPLMPIRGGANGNSFYVEIKVNGDGSNDSGEVTDASIDIELEQGSGMVCTANATYFVHASMTADGPATAIYEIGSTAGQIAAGNFQDANGDLSPTVSGTVVFTQAATKMIHLHFGGPYPYPDDITVFLRVNGGEFYHASLSCQG